MDFTFFISSGSTGELPSNAHLAPSVLVVHTTLSYVLWMVFLESNHSQIVVPDQQSQHYLELVRMHTFVSHFGPIESETLYFSTPSRWFKDVLQFGK